MFAFLRSARRSGGPKGPRGCRAYAIGDVHGRLDLLTGLLARIEDDAAGRPRARTLVVFLGDLVDRGPDSAGVLDFLRRYRPPGIEPVFLSGNHEEVMLRVAGGERGLLTRWLQFGGAQCLASYGVDATALRAMPERNALERVLDALPPEHVAFLDGCADTLRFGDYLFVHAGIRPGLSLERQTQEDLHWVREPFLSDTRDHGFVVVHGHTISKSIDERPNRIGIDTGAYRSGLLTAVAVEGAERWYLQEQGAPAPQATAATAEPAAL